MKTNIAEYFAPKAKDNKYTQTEQLRISLIMRMDSYKFSHPFAYKPGMRSQTSYGCARVAPDNPIVMAGPQLLIKRFLTETLTMADIDLAEEFSIAHFGRKLFFREGWEQVVNVYGGKLPLIIRALPEGFVAKGQDPLYTVTVLDDPLVAWMSAAFETLIQRGVWYPTTIATNDYLIKAQIKEFYDRTGADLALLPYSVHDFGGRGVTCGEQAETGGGFHTFSFMGSDTVEGILTANFYYKDPMSAFSVYATEHAVQCSFGESRENAIEYLRQQLKQVKALGLPIVSIVLDGYDVYRETEILCTDLKQDILDCGAKVVFRPDSGDMMEVVPRLLRMQEKAFGYNMTSKGFKQIKTVGVIQGDGVDHLSIVSLLGKVTAILGYSADCVIFGSGGALLQKLNRDTFKFAQKSCAIQFVGSDEWVGTAKNPVTDRGKKSKEGVLTLIKNDTTGETRTIVLNQEVIPDGWTDQMQLIYYKGDLYNETTLSEVRQRLAV